MSSSAPRRMRWTSIAIDPNSVDALRLRSEQLRAVRPLGRIKSREVFLAEIVRGRRVLDIGCVDHFPGAAGRPGFLHSKIVAAAAECVGVDIDTEGVEQLRQHGFAALRADVTDEQDRAAIVARGPFDVIVAGEVMEHLETPGSLFALAAASLGQEGRLVLTTPNPYAPHRVATGRRMVAWENTDHLVYLFPSGIVELASRHNLVLESAGTTGPRSWTSPTYLLARWLGVRLVGSRRVAAIERRRQRADDPECGPELIASSEGSRSFRDVPLFDALSLALTRPSARHWTGETAVYVLRRLELPGAAPEAHGDIED